MWLLGPSLVTSGNNSAEHDLSYGPSPFVLSDGLILWPAPFTLSRLTYRSYDFFPCEDVFQKQNVNMPLNGGQIINLLSNSQAK